MRRLIRFLIVKARKAADKAHMSVVVIACAPIPACPETTGAQESIVNIGEGVSMVILRHHVGGCAAAVQGTPAITKVVDKTMQAKLREIVNAETRRNAMQQVCYSMKTFVLPTRQWGWQWHQHGSSLTVR